MKNGNNTSVAKLLKNLDSYELKELRSQFHTQYSETIHRLAREEQEQIRVFIDGLSLDRSWYETQRDAVSLNRYNLPIEHRRTLNGISDAISKGFRELDELKTEVARDARRTGTPYSKVFSTTVKRMNRYKGNN